MELVNSNKRANEATNGNGDEGAAWERDRNDINPQRRPSVSDVCARASADAPNNLDAALANNLRDSNATERAMAYTFGIAGAVLAMGGAALRLVLSLTSSSRSSRVDVSRVVGFNVSGASLRVRF